MEKVKNISKSELKQIKENIGEAFVTNELFHEFGNVEERRELVMKYMDAYVQFVYEARALFRTTNGQGYIGLCYSEDKNVMAKFKMLIKLFICIPTKTIKSYMGHVKQIAGANERYATHPHIEVLMVCVNKESQGKGIARELIEYAKEMAKEYKVPLLLDTDMPEYAKMYQYLGCTLYNTVEATNGVVRYNLVWNEFFDRNTKKPILKCSICTGEKVAGFKDVQTGKFEEVMLIKDDKDLVAFKEKYGVDTIEKEY